jgi:tRNA threonylcarbamoyl adenosine modification protein YeaZ
MYLAIVTASDAAGLALFENGQVLDEVNWNSGQNHTTELLPKLDELLFKNEVAAGTIKGIVVAKGPGSFNGLRVGLSTAKGLAFSLGVPIAGVSSLAAEACRYIEEGLPIIAAFEAGRNELAAATFMPEAGKLPQLAAEHITTAIALTSETKEKTIFCGEINDENIEIIKQKLGEKAVFPPQPSASRVACLAKLGAERLESGDADDVAALSALYLRRPLITEAKKRKYPILK